MFKKVLVLSKKPCFFLKNQLTLIRLFSFLWALFSFLPFFEPIATLRRLAQALFLKPALFSFVPVQQPLRSRLFSPAGFFGLLYLLLEQLVFFFARERIVFQFRLIVP